MTAATQATADEPVGTSRRHTSEPRWPLDRPALDESAKHVVVVASPADPAARASSAAWIAEAATLGQTHTAVDGPGPALTAALEPATTGTRVVVAGDEATLARTLATALAAGHVATEVRAHLTDPAGLRPVQCVHCQAITETREPVDGEVACSGCDAPLLIFPHYSRRIGAYLGFRADAEELPA